MFYGCSALTTAPALPATTLADICYEDMFDGCKALTSAPALKAEILTTGCYKEMFQACKALTIAPELPAKTLADSCYYSMFYGSGITSSPELPAEAVCTSCYLSMFASCKSLTSVGKIKATTLDKETAMNFMFRSCTNLVVEQQDTADSDSFVTLATITGTDAAKWMFKSCKGYTGEDGNGTGTEGKSYKVKQ